MSFSGLHFTVIYTETVMVEGKPQFLLKRLLLEQHLGETLGEILEHHNALGTPAFVFEGWCRFLGEKDVF